MTGEAIIEAMAYVDPALVEDARTAPVRRRLGSRRLTAALIAAALVSALGTGTAAYYNGWFADYFAERNGGELTESQRTVIEAMTAVVGQSQTVDGWTVTVDRAIASKNTAYIKLDVTAPQGREPAADGGGYHFAQTELTGIGTYVEADGGWVQTMVEDDGGLDRTFSILWHLDRTVVPESTASYADGSERMLTLRELTYYDENGKLVPIEDGPWQFRFVLPAAEEIEMLTEPGPVRAVLPQSKTKTDVELTSLRITALGAACQWNYAHPWALDFPKLRAVMKDGTVVKAEQRGSSGQEGIASFEWDVPIDLNAVDHVKFQGVSLSMPD